MSGYALSSHLSEPAAGRVGPPLGGRAIEVHADDQDFDDRKRV
jgi:hypothetical protein